MDLNGEAYISHILSERFQLNELQVKRFLNDTSNKGDIEAKLRLLDSNDLLTGIVFEEGTDVFSAPLFSCTFEEAEFALQIPEMMHFSESQKQEYYKRVLYWSRFTDMRNTVLPSLEKICDKETAVEIL